MNRVSFARRASIAIAALSMLASIAGISRAESIGELSGELSSLQAQMDAAESNQTTASQVVTRLDDAESGFAKLASGGRADKGALVPLYHQLDSMLERMYSTYKKKKDDCIAQIDSGGQCDYDIPEQLALRSLYPLSWLRFQAATTLFEDNAEQSKRLLNQSIDGFTESTLAMIDPNLTRENLLGRAFCERELGKFNKADYERAIADFKTIMEGGPQTPQYKAARQGLSTTYMKMGQADKAATMMDKGESSGAGGQMLQLQTLFSAERATGDPAKKAEYHRQIIDLMKSKENEREGWAIDVAAASRYPSNAVEEFGNSSDPFEKWLLANVMLSRHDENAAARYYAEAAASGRYPKGYKFAADIYLRQKRYDQVESLLSRIAGGSGADAQWAAYMKYNLAHSRWEQAGSKDPNLEQQWVKAAEEYLQKNPQGEHAAEQRFRLAERLQHQGKLAEAAAMYSQIRGSSDFSFGARFNGAECNYLALVNAGNAAKNNKDAAKVDTAALKKAAIDGLAETIRMAPEAERNSSAAGKRFVHETKGRAIYMLAGLLEQNTARLDYAQIGSLLTGYESQYPSMAEKFHDIAEWRITALDHLGKYDEVQRDVAALVERSKGNPAQGDFIKGLGIDFWKAAQAAQANNDQKSYLANARLTATAYGFFAEMVSSGKIPVKNLTGTLSILGQAYQALGDEARAEIIFNQVVKADPSSPDANAGLARIAQARHNLKDAVTMWSNVENTAAESDNLWYDAKYNIAVIYSEQGNLQGACTKLAQTRAEHPTLGTPEMAQKWNALQRKLCLDHRK